MGITSALTEYSTIPTAKAVSRRTSPLVLGPPLPARGVAPPVPRLTRHRTGWIAEGQSFDLVRTEFHFSNPRWITEGQGPGRIEYNLYTVYGLENLYYSWAVHEFIFDWPFQGQRWPLPGVCWIALASFCGATFPSAKAVQKSNQCD